MTIVQARGNGRAGGGRVRKPLSADARAKKKERDQERRAEQAREAQKIIGVDGEGEDRACGECDGCDPPDPDAPRQCGGCKTWIARSYWPNRRCPECNASACISPRHIYTYIAAVAEDGELVAEAYNADGLSHSQCCEMLLSLPREALSFGYMFSYDTTKIIEDMPASERFYLMRPKFRETHICEDCGQSFSRFVRVCPKCGSERLKKKMQPLRFGARTYDFFNGSLTIAEKVAAQGEEKTRRVKIWDCFRFFGCAFVEALKDWKVGTEEQVERISAMKQKRGAFDVEDPEAVKKYCQEECHLLAVMMRRVIEAHDNAGIPLKRYEGAGSTATALLKKFDVAVHKGPKLAELDSEISRSREGQTRDEEKTSRSLAVSRSQRLSSAIASAFFGGRFEDSVVGIIREPIHGFDISSAYPFALTDLPCLSCGRWYREEKTPRSPERQREWLQKLLDSGCLVLCEFRVRKLSFQERDALAWGPLPFRDEKGSIAYGTNFTGWAWGPEILSALAGWPEMVTVGGAWIYETPCRGVHRPFEFLPTVYRERIRWGKEGAGKALKLGMNASYGKTAQSIGDDPPFQSWIWAGMTTAVTRGLLNDAICSATDRWNVLTLATDGIYATEPLKLWHRKSAQCTCENPEALPGAPKDTGTGDLPKPLGGWEHKSIPEGVFVAKPGLYWRLAKEATTKEEEKQQLAELRARGIGRREAFSGRRLLEEGFLAWDRRDPKYGIDLMSRRFYGAKHSILGYASCDRCKRGWSGVPEQPCPCTNAKCPGKHEGRCGRCGTSFEARFVKDKNGAIAYGRWSPRQVKIGFDPYPKREREGLPQGGTSARLRVRDLGDKTSAPYDVGAIDPASTPEGMAAREAKEFGLEQPDWEDRFSFEGGEA